MIFTQDLDVGSSVASELLDDVHLSGVELNNFLVRVEFFLDGAGHVIVARHAPSATSSTVGASGTSPGLIALASFVGASTASAAAAIVVASGWLLSIRVVSSLCAILGGITVVHNKNDSSIL